MQRFWTLYTVQTPLQVDHYPVHTVAVERAVKVVTEAAAAVPPAACYSRKQRVVVTLSSKASFIAAVSDAHKMMRVFLLLCRLKQPVCIRSLSKYA